MSKIAIIRLKGLFSISPTIEKTLESLKLTKLYSCTVISLNPSSKGMLQIAKDVTAYGEIDEKALALLLFKRGKSLDGKKLSATKKPAEIEKLAKEINSSEKRIEEFGVQSLFALSPPKGGFDGSRKSGVPYGPLGKNKDISGLIAKMA